MTAANEVDRFDTLSTGSEGEEYADFPQSINRIKKQGSMIEQKRHDIPNNFFARVAKFMARNPWTHLFAALSISTILSVVGMVVGNFNVAVDNAGWQSRGTLIADRQQQVLLILLNQDVLAYGDPAEWNKLEDVVQPGWESSNFSEDNRRLMVSGSRIGKAQSQHSKVRQHTAPFLLSDAIGRTLQEYSGFAGCDVATYSENQLDKSKLWPMWKTKSTVSAHDPRSIKDICIAEENTQALLEANNLCEQCGTGRCYPPYSLVLFARIVVNDTDLKLSCEQLSDAWSEVVGSTEKLMQDCVPAITLRILEQGNMPMRCPTGFSPTMIDDAFGPYNNFVEYTSSIFQTTSDQSALYKIANEYDRAESSQVIYGAYDTADEAFADYFVDKSIGNDMILALGSAIVTTVAMLVHSKSIWITIIGLVEVILSFPLGYFVYTFIARMEFFPFLNFIGVFVLFALGADDVFVAIDKWKNARIDNRLGTVEDVAAVALPDAAAAMFMTTITTAVAFFSTAISPVAPLKCFAVFCGLLIMFAYILCVALVFPALCIYDNWLQRGSNFFCSFHCFAKKGETIDEFPPEDDVHPSLIRRILTVFYNGFHKARWLILLVSIGATITSAIFAARLKQPQSSDVRLLSNTIMYEQAYEWRLHELYSVLVKSGGAPGYVIWGVTAADTGDHANPQSWTQLVLDESFDMSPVESQEYMLKFCDKFFAEDFAEYTEERYECAINRFDRWLKKESNSTSPSIAYNEYCAGATGLPMQQEAFNSCIIAWTDITNDVTILEKDGIVKVVIIAFQQRIRFDSPFDELDKEWKALESWFQSERSAAPDGVNGMYHTSSDFWWYDTNGNMLQAAFGSGAIALAFSGLVVLIVSKSIMLTLFSVLTIGFVLCSTTALLVASGWTLGFLESVCFAILIGISCDFVLHFAHAYISKPGNVDRHERTKYALLHIGPSILAAAFTTIAGAVVMIFCVISFFRKFAQILFYTILMATIGAFVMFLSLTDTIGPSQPTYVYDMIKDKCCSKKDEQRSDEVGGATSERNEATIAKVKLCDDASLEA